MLESFSFLTPHERSVASVPDVLPEHFHDVEHAPLVGGAVFPVLVLDHELGHLLLHAVDERSIPTIDDFVHAPLPISGFSEPAA